MLWCLMGFLKQKGSQLQVKATTTFCFKNFSLHSKWHFEVFLVKHSQEILGVNKASNGLGMNCVHALYSLPN